MQRARLYLDARYAEPCRLADVARTVGLSEAHLSVLFGRFVGVSPHQYLLRLRLEAARRLLVETGLSVTGVCFEVGFQHPSHFAASFRRTFGVTPVRFRHARHAPATGHGARGLAVVGRGVEGPDYRTDGNGGSAGDAGDEEALAYFRRGSALYTYQVALRCAGTGAGDAIDRLTPYLRRPDRRRTALKLLGWVFRGTGLAGVERLRPVLAALADLPEGVDIPKSAPLLLAEALRGASADDALAVLRPCLTSESVEVRRAAVRAAGIACRDRGTPAVLEALQRQMGCGDGLIDNLAVVSLGLAFRQTADPAAVELLRDALAVGVCRLVHDHTQSPACLCTSSFGLVLVCRGTPRATEAEAAIAPILASADPSNVADALVSLAALYMGAAPNGLDLLLPRVVERAPVGRTAAGRLPLLFEGVTEAHRQRAALALPALLHSPSLTVRRVGAVAAGALGRGRGDDALAALLESTLGHPSSKLRGDALLALGLIDHGRGSGRLVGLLARREPRTPYEARSGLLALGLAAQGTGDSAADRVLASRLAASNGYVRRAAALALGLLYQGTRAQAPKRTLLDLAASDRALWPTVDQAVLMVDFDRPRLSLLSEGTPHVFGDYANSFYLTQRYFSRLRYDGWDVDEPVRVG
ncbi:MAG: helix-turn-helix domain-containing protein [Chloroflexota bacterium]